MAPAGPARDARQVRPGAPQRGRGLHQVLPARDQDDEPGRLGRAAPRAHQQPRLPGPGLHRGEAARHAPRAGARGFVDARLSQRRRRDLSLPAGAGPEPAAGWRAAVRGDQLRHPARDVRRHRGDVPRRGAAPRAGRRDALRGGERQQHGLPRGGARGVVAGAPAPRPGARLPRAPARCGPCGAGRGLRRAGGRAADPGLPRERGDALGGVPAAGHPPRRRHPTGEVVDDRPGAPPGRHVCRRGGAGAGSIRGGGGRRETGGPPRGVSGTDRPRGRRRGRQHGSHLPDPRAADGGAQGLGACERRAARRPDRGARRAARPPSQLGAPRPRGEPDDRRRPGGDDPGDPRARGARAGASGPHR